jgi:hypothetical protein
VRFPAFRNRAPLFPIPGLTREEFAEAFDIDAQAPYLRVLLDPRGIRKLRGQKIGDLGNQDRAKLCIRISDTIRPTHDIQEIPGNCDGASAATGDFEKVSVLSAGIEDVIPIGREFDSRIRDTYLFVSTAGADGSAALKRFEAFLDTQLIRDERNLRHLSYQP